MRDFGVRPCVGIGDTHTAQRTERPVPGVTEPSVAGDLPLEQGGPVRAHRAREGRVTTGFRFHVAASLYPLAELWGVIFSGHSNSGTQKLFQVSFLPSPPTHLREADAPPRAPGAAAQGHGSLPPAAESSPPLSQALG